jgi:hypothetical protein
MLRAFMSPKLALVLMIITAGGGLLAWEWERAHHRTKSVHLPAHHQHHRNQK